MHMDKAGAPALSDRYTETMARIAETYGYDIESTTAARLKYDLVRQNTTPTDRVLDIGCGNGIHMHVLADHCRHIDGIDLNARMLDHARAKLSERAVANAEVHLGDAEALPFPDGHFDLVYSFSTLLLVPRIRRAIAEIARVLRPGGTAVLDITGRWNLSQLYWGRYWRANGHFGVHAFGWRDTAAMLAAGGLTVREAHASGFTDQWKYVPLLRRLTAIDRVLHDGSAHDRDYRISNLPGLRRLANRWYVIAKRAVANDGEPRRSC